MSGSLSTKPWAKLTLDDQWSRFCYDFQLLRIEGGFLAQNFEVGLPRVRHACLNCGSTGFIWLLILTLKHLHLHLLWGHVRQLTVEVWIDLLATGQVGKTLLFFPSDDLVALGGYKTHKAREPLNQRDHQGDTNIISSST